MCFAINHGSYYARAFARGKEVWKSLKTAQYSIAQAWRVFGPAVMVPPSGRLVKVCLIAELPVVITGSDPALWLPRV